MGLAIVILICDPKSWCNGSIYARALGLAIVILTSALTRGPRADARTFRTYSSFPATYRAPRGHIRNYSLIPRILLGLYTDIFITYCEPIPEMGTYIQTNRQTDGATVLIY